MFDARIKETLCTHWNICTYKQDCRDILKAVENVTVSGGTSNGKIESKKVINYDFISGISIGCKYYQCVHKNVCKYAEEYETYRNRIKTIISANNLEPYGHFKLNFDCDQFEATTFSRAFGKFCTKTANIWPSGNLKE